MDFYIDFLALLKANASNGPSIISYCLMMPLKCLGKQTL